MDPIGIMTLSKPWDICWRKWRQSRARQQTWRGGITLIICSQDDFYQKPEFRIERFSVSFWSTFQLICLQPFWNVILVFINEYLKNVTFYYRVSYFKLYSRSQKRFWSLEICTVLLLLKYEWIEHILHYKVVMFLWESGIEFFGLIMKFNRLWYLNTWSITGLES